MAKDKTDYTTKDTNELMRLLEENDKKLLEAKVDLAERKTHDVHLPMKLRREKAKIKTEINRKSQG